MSTPKSASPRVEECLQKINQHILLLVEQLETSDKFPLRKYVDRGLHLLFQLSTIQYTSPQKAGVACICFVCGFILILFCIQQGWFGNYICRGLRRQSVSSQILLTLVTLCLLYLFLILFYAIANTFQQCFSAISVFDMITTIPYRLRWFLLFLGLVWYNQQNEDCEVGKQSGVLSIITSTYGALTALLTTIVEVIADMFSLFEKPHNMGLNLLVDFSWYHILTAVLVSVLILSHIQKGMLAFLQHYMMFLWYLFIAMEYLVHTFFQLGGITVQVYIDQCRGTPSYTETLPSGNVTPQRSIQPQPQSQTQQNNYLALKTCLAHYVNHLVDLCTGWKRPEIVDENKRREIKNKINETVVGQLLFLYRIGYGLAKGSINTTYIIQYLNRLLPTSGKLPLTSYYIPLQEIRDWYIFVLGYKFENPDSDVTQALKSVFSKEDSDSFRDVMSIFRWNDKEFGYRTNYRRLQRLLRTQFPQKYKTDSSMFITPAKKSSLPSSPSLPSLITGPVSPKEEFRRVIPFSFWMFWIVGVVTIVMTLLTIILILSWLSRESRLWKGMSRSSQTSSSSIILVHFIFPSFTSGIFFFLSLLGMVMTHVFCVQVTQSLSGEDMDININI